MTLGTGLFLAALCVSFAAIVIFAPANVLYGIFALIVIIFVLWLAASP